MTCFTGIAMIVLSFLLICYYSFIYWVDHIGCSKYIYTTHDIYHCVNDVLVLNIYDNKVTYIINVNSSHNETVQQQLPKAMICTMMLDDDKLYVDEWIQYNKLIGFDYIQIYDNSLNQSDYLANLTTVYKDFVNIQHYPGQKKQKEVYNDCVNKNKNSNTWAAMIDTDEFIVLRKHQSIKHLLLDLKPNGGALILNWVMFGTNGHLHYENKPVLERFTERAMNTALVGKSISYLPDVIEYGIHVPIKLLNYKKTTDVHYKIIGSRTRTPYPATEDIAAIYHYYTKSYEEFEHKNIRGRANSVNAGKRFQGPEGKALNHRMFIEGMKKWNLDKNTIQDNFAFKQFKNKSVKEF